MVTILIIRRGCYSDCGARAVAEDMCCVRMPCYDGLHMSFRGVLRQIQDSVSVTFFLCHIWAESLGWHCKALLAQISSPRSREYICSASRESRGCGTEGEQYAAWAPGCLYLWFDEGI